MGEGVLCAHSECCAAGGPRYWKVKEQQVVAKKNAKCTDAQQTTIPGDQSRGRRSAEARTQRQWRAWAHGGKNNLVQRGSSLNCQNIYYILETLTLIYIFLQLAHASDKTTGTNLLTCIAVVLTRDSDFTWSCYEQCNRSPTRWNQPMKSWEYESNWNVYNITQKYSASCRLAVHK